MRAREWRADWTGLRVPRAGLTLAEIMVAMTVLGLLMTAALTLMIPSLGRMAVADTMFDAERNALLGLRMLMADLRETSARELWRANGGGVGSPPTPVFTDIRGLLIPTPRDASGAYCTDASGFPAWQEGAIYYWTQPEDSPEKGVRLFRQRIENRGKLAGPLSGRAVATGVTALAVSMGSTSAISAPGMQLFVDPSAVAVATPGGKGRVDVRITITRFLRGKDTVINGMRTVIIPY